MRYTREKIISESIPILTLCVFLQIAGGHLLNNEDSLIAIPLLLITVPVINGLFGNIGTILGARLSTGLHLGTIDLDPRNRVLRENVIQTLILGFTVILILAVLIWVITLVTGISRGTITFFQFIMIMFGTAAFMTVLVTLSCVISAFLSFRKGMDPDNTVTPAVTTTGDLMGIASLIIMVGLIL